MTRITHAHLVEDMDGGAEVQIECGGEYPRIYVAIRNGIVMLSNCEGRQVAGADLALFPEQAE